LLPLECFPGGHATHTRSTVEEGVFDTKVPAAQVLQAWQLAALAVVLN
jgi:hypothetical protein